MELHTLVAFVGALLCSGLAVFVLWKNPRSLEHWSFAIGMGALALKQTCWGLSTQQVEPEVIYYWEYWGIVAIAGLPGSWLLFSLSFARAHSTRIVARWKWPVLATFVLPLVLVTFFQDAFFIIPPELHPPIRLLPLGWAGSTFYMFLLLASVVILMNLEETLRSSTGSKRWRIKFMILGLGSLFAIQIYTASQTLLFSALDRELRHFNSYALIIAATLILISLTRQRFLTMDIYLSQSVLCNSITMLVVGLYLVIVGILAKVIASIGGHVVFPLGTFFVFLAIIGLASVLLSDQLRHHARRIISQHFRRPQYDYRQVWIAFTQQTSSLLDIPELCGAVSTMVSEIFGIPNVSIWLANEALDSVSLGGSTALAYGPSIHQPFMERGAIALLHALQDQENPVDLATPPASVVKKLEQSEITVLQKAGIRYSVPLVANQQLLGVMTLSERLTEERFSLEEVTLLKTIVDQAAGSLLNLKLSQRLVHAKEMEAFHTLSAFFLHDLKNTASMLSLMLRNLPVHYDNPAFREDALRVISQSVSKLNTMCSRLSLFHKKLELYKREVELNTLVADTLASLNGCIKAALVQNLRAIPRLSLDPEQMQKVLTNLIFNAQEAVDINGEICLETEQQGDWVVLTVRDNGCGMTKEFIAHSLFKPFHTTKKQGLGIGLFQSKMIIEAHQGKIEVESEEGKGTTFRILLPAHTVH